MKKGSVTDANGSTSRRSFVKLLGFAAIGSTLGGAQAWAAALCDNRLRLVRHSTFVMGQVANATIVHADADHARSVVTKMFAELRRLEGMMSVFDPASRVSAINRAAGDTVVRIEPEMRELLSEATRIGRQTRGALDITVEPLMRLWGFRGANRVERPTDREIAETLDVVGISGLVMDASDAGLARRGSALDLGGVAVGYALDRIAAIARAEGIERALLELSGDFYAIGAPPECRKGWEIGVVDPRREGAIARRLFIRDQALSTSGNYAATVVYQARRYGHIFDPSRGLPSERIHSATVVAPTALLSDAYSTALFVSDDRSLLPNTCSVYVLRV